ncbi:hypothetical protein [Nocardioides sp. URHA0032]|uniref:hypothetical protein n=1 Tax=Nocardioides sp. URHA0032 TaxID=1380388 RepID=UPI0012DC333B|nr:hypothetical protein [Nocardioides sp. URHA0032]
MFIPDWMVLAFAVALVAGLALVAVVYVGLWLASAVHGAAFAMRPDVRRVNREYRATRHVTRPLAQRAQVIRAAHWEQGRHVPDDAQAAWRARLQADADAYWEQHPDETTLPPGFVEALVVEYRERPMA